MQKINSQKLKNALAASISVVLAFLFPLYFGINDTTSAAMTIMVIATSNSLETSLSKGIYRVLGTIIGAILGILLIALFPQEQFLYFFVTSIFVFIIMYLARAYRGDKTIFLLTAMTMMMMFQGGNINNIYITALQKTLLTIIGIGIYTFISIYIFPTKTSNNTTSQKGYFIWFDPFDIKGAIISWLIFLSANAIWVYFAIPNSYIIAILATSFSLYTTFSIIKAKHLIILFSLAFLFATISYIFILPHLNGWWELALFIFVYSFIGFYFINPQISIFFLIGLTTFMIQNQMFYNFELFIFILFIFYLFLFILLLFDYFPFNQQPHYLFLYLQKYFYTLLQKENTPLIYLKEIFQKMETYAKMIDYQYFQIDQKEIENYLQIAKQALQERNFHLLKQKQYNFTPLKKGKF